MEKTQEKHIKECTEFQMEKEFNNYPKLEEKYGEIAFEIYKRDIDLIDKIFERLKNGKRI